MPEVREIAAKVRSKNAGPFWITVDVFCGTADAFERIRDDLASEAVAALFETPPETLRRFDIPDLRVVKFSFPRRHVQGDPRDRDMHGASYAALLAELRLD